MTFLDHSVPSSFDKNASSLQHTDAFSIGSAKPQADHPLCLRPRDVRAIRYLISYIFCNLLRLTSD